MEHWLVFREPSGQEKVYPLRSQSTTIGRAPDNDIVFLNEHSISRKHASVVLEEGDYYLVDLGSKNGTKVGGRLVKRHKLEDNEQILLGKVVLTFRLASSERVQRARIIDDSKELDSVGTIIKSLDDLMFEDELSALDKIGPSAGGSLESAAARRTGAVSLRDSSSEIEKNNLKLKIMYRVASKLNSVPTLQKFLEEVLEMAFQVVGAERGFLKLLDDGEPGGGLEVVRFMGVSRDDSITLSKTIADAAVNQKVAILVHDAQIDSRFCQEDSVQLYGIRSALCVPIWNRTKIYGILYVDCLLSSRTFGEEDMELLTALSNQAAIGIERQRLDEAYKEESRRRSHMARYFSPEVVDVIINKKSAREIEEREVTVLFADVSGFTTLSERLTPTEIVELLNKFFELCTDIIFQYHGTLDKFIGDCVMGLFGVPLPLLDAPERAISAALEITEGLFLMNKDRPEDRRIDVRIGINTGRAVVGDIGPINRLEYTVLGDSVNTASRLQSDVARQGQIVVGESTFLKTREKFVFRELGLFPLKGKLVQEGAYEVLGRMPQVASTVSGPASTKHLLEKASVTS
jgi:adenylate cyclase